MRKIRQAAVRFRITGFPNVPGSEPDLRQAMVNSDRPFAVRGGNGRIAKRSVPGEVAGLVDLVLPGTNLSEASRSALVDEEVPLAIGPPDLRRQRAGVRAASTLERAGLDGRRLPPANRLVVSRQHRPDNKP